MDEYRNLGRASTLSPILTELTDEQLDIIAERVCDKLIAKAMKLLERIGEKLDD
jgi:hypothetical protein